MKPSVAISVFSPWSSLISSFLSVSSVLTVWTCLLTRASSSWKRSSCSPSRRLKDSAKNRRRSLRVFPLPHPSLIIQPSKTEKLHNITTNVYKLFCHFKPNLNLQHYLCSSPQIPSYPPIMKYASISARLFKTEPWVFFFNFLPLLTGFLKKRLKCWEDFIVRTWSAFKL